MNLPETSTVLTITKADYLDTCAIPWASEEAWLSLAEIKLSTGETALAFFDHNDFTRLKPMDGKFEAVVCAWRDRFPKISIDKYRQRLSAEPVFDSPLILLPDPRFLKNATRYEQDKYYKAKTGKAPSGTKREFTSPRQAFLTMFGVAAAVLTLAVLSHIGSGNDLKKRKGAWKTKLSANLIKAGGKCSKEPIFINDPENGRLLVAIPQHFREKSENGASSVCIDYSLYEFLPPYTDGLSVFRPEEHRKLSDGVFCQPKPPG